MNKQTEQFLNALKDIEEGKIVSLDKALNEEPPSDELQKIYNDIDQIDGEREAWKRMFDLQSKLVMNLELDKIKLKKENKELKKEVQMYKDILRLTDHLYKSRIKTLEGEKAYLQKCLNNVHSNLKVMTGEDKKYTLPAEWIDENL